MRKPGRTRTGIDLSPHNGLIGHDDNVIPERKPQVTDKQLEWAARKAAGSALKPDDSLLDIEVGNLKRFRDNGADKSIVTPKKWARAIPVARGVMTVTYTREQVLFLSDGLAVNCPLICIHRAQLQTDGRQLFAFARRESPLAVLELEAASRRSSTRPGGFLDRLVAIRDEERAKLPAAHRARLEQIDLVVQTQTVDELWARPSAPASLEPAEAALLATPAAGMSAEDGLDEIAWGRLRIIVDAANREDADGYAEALLWQPPDFGLAGHHRTAAYLLYLLSFRVKEALQANKPTEQQLHDLAVEIYPKLHEILENADQIRVEETLRIAFELPPVAGGVTPGDFGVFAGAVLGLLMDNPDQELAAVRPRLAGWWNRNHDSFLRQGLVE